MPRDAITGVYTRVSNSFSNPVQGTLIDPTDADALFDDQDVGLNPPNLAGPLNVINPVTIGKAGTTVGTLGFFNATSGSITLSPPTGALGTVTLTMPAATDTLVGIAASQTLTNKTIISPIISTSVVDQISYNGTSSGTTILKSAAVASGTLTLPAATDTLVGKATTDTLTNKTLTSPTLTTPSLGVATATSINKVAFTAPATSATLTLVDGTTVTGPATSGTMLISSAIGSTVQAFDAQLFSNLPQNSQSTAYTTVLTDGQKHILHPSSDNNARTFTIAANASVAYPIGTAITFVNKINTVTIAINSDTLTLAGTGSTGSRTLAVNGIATAIKIASTEWVISGAGLT